MKVKYFAITAVASILSVVMSNSSYASPGIRTISSDSSASQSRVKGCGAKPCASKPNPCAAKPCASKPNPCASKTLQSNIYTDRDGIALKGQDVVAYFTEGKPVIGSSKYTYRWKDATWQFSSALNRDLFARNPMQYAPQYGGYCAKAVSEGSLAKTEADSWKIVDGKLYLNYDRTVQAEWIKDISGNIKKADANWPGALNNKVVHR